MENPQLLKSLIGMGLASCLSIAALSFAVAEPQVLSDGKRCDPNEEGCKRHPATERSQVAREEGVYDYLVIPVVTTDTAYDPVNNQVNSFDATRPTLLNDIIQDFSLMDSFWDEASYGRVRFNTEVLQTYYQMPEGLDHYFNPDYQSANLLGSVIQPIPVVFPSGVLRLEYTARPGSVQSITINFDAMLPSI